MRSILFLCSILALVSLAGCGKEEASAPAQTATAEPAAGSAPAPSFRADSPTAGSLSSFSGSVLETMNTAGYTYARIQTADGEVWVAGPETTLAVGDDVTATGGMPMGSYTSQTLNRQFDNLYFVSALSTGASAPTASGELKLPDGHPPMEQPEVAEVHIAPAAGTLSIGDLFASADTFAGKMVVVKGQVVKFNPSIMDRNWVHLQDGTGEPSKGTHDLTVTTGDVVKVGDVVKMTGMVAVDKDFGAGYSYDLMLENAQLVKE